jgi:hypothetical protein
MFLTILHHYVVWHFSQAYLQFFRVWMNLLWFVIHFFSLPQMVRSWFSPWKRITEERKKSWDLEDFFGSLLINLLSRIIGALMRTFVIMVGLLALLIIFVGGLTVYILWTVAPALIVFLIIIGIMYIV